MSDYYEIIDQLSKDNVKFIQLQFTDLYGSVKSLTIPEQQIEDALENGVWFDGSSILGFSRICESDMYLKPDLGTYAVIPWLESANCNTARLICDVYTPDGNPFQGDPRYILKKVLQEAGEMNLEFNTGPEMEFFLFKTEDSLSPLPHDRASYFDLTMDEAYDIRREMSLALDRFGIGIESTHHEVAIGQHEISFEYDNALKTADNVITLKFTVKAIAQKHGLLATFMPKPMSEMNGSGMHVHQSLFNTKTETNVFFREDNEYKLSPTAFQYIAGQLEHISGMSAILSPTVNSYKRLVPGYEAPVYICWGRTNRSALIRVPSTFKGNPSSTRVELRSPDPSCNIYLAFAVMLKAGLSGIENKLEAPNPLEEDIYQFSNDKLRQMGIKNIPQNLWQALKALKEDKVIESALGKHTFESYLEAKFQEWNEYSIRVSQWELDTYLERY